MQSNHLVTVTGIITLKEGKWPQCKEVIDSIIRDRRIKKLIILSTDTLDKEKVTVFAKMYAEKIVLVNEDVNKGPAFIFSKAVSLAQKETTTYVLFLDDDAIPEKGLIDTFLDNLKYFKNKETSRVIMIANTIDIFGKEKSFYSSVNKKYFKDGTLFDIFSIRKVNNLIKRILGIETTYVATPPVFHTQAFIGGGTFVPMEAIKNIAPPLLSLYMHGEDIEYAWRLKETGFSFFQCTHPIIRRPSSEEKGNHHVFELFSKKTQDNEVYYHIRNAVLISRLHTYQSKPALLLNIITWITIALLLGILKSDSFKLFLHRGRIILRGVIHGYFQSVTLLD